MAEVPLVPDLLPCPRGGLIPETSPRKILVSRQEEAPGSMSLCPLHPHGPWSLDLDIPEKVVFLAATPSVRGQKCLRAWAAQSWGWPRSSWLCGISKRPGLGAAQTSPAHSPNARPSGDPAGAKGPERGLKELCMQDTLGPQHCGKGPPSTESGDTLSYSHLPPREAPKT